MSARVSIVGFVAAVVGMFAPLGVAGADPAKGWDIPDAPRIDAPLDPVDPYCFDARLCSGDFGSTYYCPDTGGFVGPFGACDALVTGPYAPGGLRPNESIYEDE